MRKRNTPIRMITVRPAQPRARPMLHVMPESRGGPWTWTNLVSACGACNNRKAARTPEEAGMPLVYLPYMPSRYESFLLEGRNIRADVHEWLARRLPKGSRLQ
jgi:hypothetical protein